MTNKKISPAGVLLKILLALLLLVDNLGEKAYAQTETPPNIPGSEEPVIYLRSGVIDPAQSNQVTSSSLSTPSPDTSSLRLIQYPSPILEEWYQALVDSGLEIVAYLPDFAYIVWGTTDEIERATVSSPVRWQGFYQPEYALHPSLTALDQSIQVINVFVQLYRYDLVEQVIDQIISNSIAVLRQPYDLLDYRNLAIQINSDQLSWLASLPGVVDVQPLRENTMLDEIQGQILAGNINANGSQPSGTGYINWLQSLGFPLSPDDYPIVDIVDDGIDDGDATPSHPDFYQFGSAANQDRLAYNANLTSDANANGLGGHGNLNASIVGGYNSQSGFPYEDGSGFNYGVGINPLGRIAGSKIFSNDGSWDYFGSIPSLVRNSYNLGGRIVSNSWGEPGTNGDYGLQDQEYDALVRDASTSISGNQQMIIIFAAGNDGPGTSTTTSPGNAKNVITVGASENYRPISTCGSILYGDNAQDIASFSSRGPTNDGRKKPDLVAPGTHIIGAATQASGYTGAGVSCKFYPSGQTLYAISSGTSHSTPAASGAASLLYKWYQTRFGGQPPSPAMLKAYMVNSTRYLTGSSANDTLPSNNQGYGIIDLGRSFDSVPRVVHDQATLFGATGQSYQLNGAVADSSKPFRVSLAWTDAPGSTVGAAYVNNLDLEVQLSGQVYKGNVFSGANSVPGGTADSRNNVESVFIPAGVSGNFTITVKATNIAGNGVPANSDSTDQDFALIVYNTGNQQNALKGTVYNGTQGGVMQGVRIQVTGPQNLSMDTNASGEYYFALPSGTYSVSAWKYGYTPQTISNVIVNNQVVSRDFSLTSANAYPLSGCITDQATGQGLAATISVKDLYGILIGQTATTIQNSCYQMNLFPGTFDILVSSRLHSNAQTTINLSSALTQNFVLSATTTEGVIFGLVKEQATGIPVEGATVSLLPGNYSAVTGSDGKYDLQLPKGSYNLSVSYPLFTTLNENNVVIPQSNMLEKNYQLKGAYLSISPSGPIGVVLSPGGQTVHQFSLTNVGQETLNYRLFETVEKSLSSVADKYGYVYIDSRQTAEAAYSWEDITSGTALNLSDDGEASVSLPFVFQYYGVSFNSIKISNNGAFRFGNPTSALSFLNQPLSGTSPDLLVAPFWDDLAPAISGNIYFKTIGEAPNRRFIVAWKDIPHFVDRGSTGPITFEVILYEGSNNIKFQYKDVVFGNVTMADPANETPVNNQKSIPGEPNMVEATYDGGVSATIGLRGSSSQYLQFSYNTSAISDGTAICFRYPGSLPCDPIDISWLSLSQALTGSLLQGNSVAFQAYINASRISSPIVDKAVLRIISNDPKKQPHYDYPITLVVLMNPVYLPIIGR